MTENLLKKRVESIDLLKGLVMVVMALDHVRDYFHFSVRYFDPVDPALTTVPIYFTRWVTNFCAPVFCFLAGLSAYLSGRKKPKAKVAVGLLKRGVWLVVLEFTVVGFGWQMDPLFRSNDLAVIGELGISMICLAGFIYLSRRWLLLVCCVIIFGHNLLDGIQFPGSMVWSLIHHAEIFSWPSGWKLYIDYPIVPWIAVMPLGYWFGAFYETGYDPAKRRRLLTMVGLSAIGLFFLLRGINIYGDPARWTYFSTSTRTILSFFNVTKYPPSLLYLLITLGPAIWLLSKTEKLRGPVVNFFTTFGRVPFFYYLCHLYLIHGLAALAGYLSGWGWKLLVMPVWVAEAPDLKGYGFSLPVIYGVWVCVVGILYPLCRRYDRYKTMHKDKWWLSYL